MSRAPASAARLSRPPAPPRRQLLLGYAASVGAALSFALGALVVRKAVTEYTTPLVTVAYSMLVACAVLAVLAGRGAVAEMARAPRAGWALAATAGTISSAAAICYYFALNFAPVVLVSPVSATAPLFAHAVHHRLPEEARERHPSHDRRVRTRRCRRSVDRRRAELR